MPADHGARLGTLHGIEIKANWSLFILVALLTWSLAAAGLPSLASGYPSAVYWIAAIVTTIVFFASLLAHELSHAIVAQRTGATVHDITLWLLGGVSRIEQEPASPHDDLHIALAGPLASLSIAIAAFLVAIVGALLAAPKLIVACALWLATINMLLVVFNLVPAAPLDGGRVLRAILWRRSGDRQQAAISASKAGRVFAYVLFGVGFAEFAFAGDLSGLWFVILGAFVLTMSRAEETQARLTRDLAGVQVREVMTPQPMTVPSDISVERVLHDYVLALHCSSFPVRDVDSRVVGLLTLRQLRAVPVAQRPTVRAGDVALPLAWVLRASPDELLLDVLRRAENVDDDRILVFAAGELVGIVSSSDVSRLVQLIELQRAH
jgi:Zn-dependent protease